MSRFQEVNTHLMSVLIKLVENDDLCKLINYNSYTPLSESSLDDNNTLLFNKIYPYPFTPDVENEACTILNVLFENFELGKNIYTKDTNLTFIVLCHNDVWRIENMLRPFAILNQIDEMFNKQNGYGLGKLEFNQGSLLWANVKYSGYRVSYKLCDFN